MVERLKVLHELGYVHNDLKLENIVIGHEDKSLIYLIDFGLSTKYLDKDGKHVKQYFTEYFSGNFLFASINSCKGNNKTRKDDLESLLYIMIFMLYNKLPWCHFKESAEHSFE